MSGRIRAQVPSLIAVLVVMAAGLGTLYVLFQEQRLRIPILEERPFELKAEFETLQAVVPGQGQSIRVAGIKIGSVEAVELDDGVGVVTFGVERDYLPIFRDATILMRPTTGLKDMFFELDPGTRDAGAVPEGGTVPLANTAPDVNLDEVLAALDADTQAYLRAAIVAAGDGLDGRGADAGRVLAALGPINSDLRRLNSKIAQRKDNLAHLVHVVRRLTGEVGRQDDDLTELVSASNAAIGAIAAEAPDVREAVRLLPGTLREGTETLGLVSDLGARLGPSASALRPFARNLDGLTESARSLATESTPVLSEEIRPFVREARGPVRDLSAASRPLANATPRLAAVGAKANDLANILAYNPRGAEAPGTPGRDEGYLYWAAWLAHTGDSVFEAQDAHGLYRRIYLTQNCSNAAQQLSSGPLAPFVTGLGPLFAAGGPCAS